jgi:16S rRNA (adenine1518-N6/adenine1519-N6)-dimethyltransferase
MQRVQPNKSYGQHFLRDKSVVSRTLEILDTHYPGKQVLEIGPGTGALTSALLIKYADVLHCVEVDNRCVDYLEEHYPALKGRIIQEDFLRLQLEGLVGEETALVGNFPYNISSQIVFKLLEYKHLFPVMIGMFQKEVAYRIAAPHGNKEYGILSVLTQLYYDAEICFDIAPEAFNPPPKVMSSVLLLQRKKNAPVCNSKLLTQVVKAGFNQRRKMLRNALNGIVPSEYLQEPFFQKRAEQITVEEYVELTHRIEHWKSL